MKNLIRKIRAARAAFTLMEVNLAIFIMAVGVLAMTSLYPLGFRESQQSRDDVRAAIVANEVLGQLTAVLSSRKITWEEWESKMREAVNKNGWYDYFDDNTHVIKTRKEVQALAQKAFDDLVSLSKNEKPKSPFSDDKYAYGLVVQWGKRVVAKDASGGASFNSESIDDHSRVSISFRMARRVGSLMAAPIYYTEVHFQGVQTGEGNGQ